MYTFVKAVVLGRSIGMQWTVEDISNTLVFDIYNTYTQVYLELANVYLDHTVYVDFYSLKNEFSTYSGTLNDLLKLLGDRTLPTVESLPDTDVKYVKYSDAFRSEYLVDLTNIGVNLPANYPKSEMHDLYIQRPGYNTDLTLLHTHCLITVNGYVHKTDTDGKLAYVYGGADTMRKSRNNQLGIISFYDLGAIDKRPILGSNIHPENTDTPLRKRTYITIDTDIANKSVFMVLGGYLLFPENNVFWQSGTNAYAINFEAIPLLERYYESVNSIDLSGLQLSNISTDPDIINVDDLLSDDVLKRYLSLSQTFFVVVDIPNLLTSKLYLRHCNMPGMFTSYQDPTYPLIVNYGKIAEYWKAYEDGFYSVTVTDSYYRNFVFDHSSYYSLKDISSNKVPQNTYNHSRGYLLQISGYH